MTAFGAAVNVMFGDPNMSEAATWTACSGGPSTPCRVIISQPDDLDRFGDGQIVRDTVKIDVRVSQVESPGSGDTVVVGGVSYRIQGQPMRDRLRLVWKCEAREV